MVQVAQLVRSVGPARLAAMGAVAAMMVGFFAFLILRFSSASMVPLYTDLSFDDSGAIIRELETRNIPFELRREGSTILVPQEEVLRLRMDLAIDGLPSGGGVGYEIFDRSDTLGATSFVQNVNHVRALEGELSRTIRAIDRVTGARVHLVIPERQLFTRNQPEPSASIVLQARGALEPAQIRAVQHLVAAAVQGLVPGRVSVVDEAGRLLADGRGTDEAGSVHVLNERRHEIERQLRTQVEDILASIVGRDRVRVQVAAELDFNRVTQTSDLYDPESQVVRSTQVNEESSTSAQAGNDGVTVANELPDAQPAGGSSAQENSERTEEVVNYEISRTTKTEVIEPGRIRRISVAVVVDGIYNQNAEGDIVYEPRPQDQLDRIAALVRSAIGYDESRGDSVEIANLRFAEPPQAITIEEPDSFLPTLTGADLMRLAESAVLAVLAILALFTVVRPLMRRVLARDETGATAIAVPAGFDAAPQIAGAPEPARLAPPAGVPARGEAIALAQVAGEAQSSVVSRVGQLINDNPGEAVSIIRTWIQEPA